MKKQRLAVTFTGPSNSGKTTLIVKLSTLLQKKGYKVAIIKHDPKDKAIFDKEGKDSYKFTNTGADVAVVSPNRTTVFKKESSSIDNIISMMTDFDYLLVEGLKTLPLPRICVQRESINEKYFEVTDTIASDNTIDKTKLPEGMTTIDLNDIEAVIKWINKNGKKV
ncbi:MAG: molybdopterin-guanine dinucleotide biosynthesis protein B [Campylobacterota bacterium]|nr:molybdopterin-guanine dinucleotide biosynthesis protein B [Campylobacterota bacterium]